VTYTVMAITGKVGGALGRSLLDAGASVRAVVRDESKAREWRRRGCEIAVADVNNVDALTSAFNDSAGIFVLLPPVFDPSPGFAEALESIASIRQALARAKPPKVVCLSTVGADADRPNLLNQLRLLEESLQTLPIPITFLRAAWFIDNAAFDMGSARNGRIESFLQPLDRKFPMVAARDVGAIAAQLLLQSWNGQRVVALEGPRRLSPNDLATAFSEVLGRTVTAEIVERDRWESLFLAQGMKNPTPRMQMLDGFNQGWIDFSDGGESTRHGPTELITVIRTIAETAT
jgi:NAD(P)H dehydrogenase (quinone)